MTLHRILGSARTLPHTGFPIAFYTAIGLLCVLCGLLARYATRAENGNL